MDTLPEFVWVDYVIIGIIAVSSIISLMRGFVKEALSLVVWAVAIGVAWFFFRELAVQLTPYIDVQSVRLGVAFAILMIATLIVGGIVNFIISQLVEKTGLSGTDRLLGMIFGAGRGILLIAILVWLAGLTPFPQDAWWQQSALLHYFSDLSVWLRDLLPPNIGDFFTYGKEAV